MKPDRKQPARASALPSSLAAKLSPSANSGAAGQQLQDWYVIADEGDLTLRISSGLRVGEDRWGELTLNHPLSAHRWLEFVIDGDGQLWCRSCRKDIAIRCNGEILDEVPLGAGVPIALPHNLLHISNYINRGQSTDWQLEIGLLEPDTTSNQQFDQAVDTQHDAPRTAAGTTANSAASTSPDQPTPEAERGAIATAASNAAGNKEQTVSKQQVAQQDVAKQATANQNAAPERAAKDDLASNAAASNPAAQRSGERAAPTPIPTLETVVATSRPLASGDAGPAIERAVAKLKNRTGSYPAYGHANRAAANTPQASATAESVESALVPVDANGPFDTEEIKAALQQPIHVPEPGSPQINSPTGWRRSAEATGSPVQQQRPIFTPSVTTGTNTRAAFIAGSGKLSQQQLGLGLALTLLVVTALALLVALNAGTDNRQDRSLTAGSATQGGNTLSPQPDHNLPTATPKPRDNTDNRAVLQPPSTQQSTSQARTNSLLQTAAALMADAESLDTDTLNFAVRSLNLVLAAEPDNTQAAGLLQQAQLVQAQRAAEPKPSVIQNRIGDEPTTLSGTLSGTPSGTPSGTINGTTPSATNEPATSNPTTAVVQAPANATPDTPNATAGGYGAAVQPLGSGGARPLSSESQFPTASAPLVDWRLRRADELLASGNVLMPRDDSAVNLILSVLAEDPNHRNAVNMLNKSAEILVRQADFEYRTEGEYAARNTLEEVLSFHPRHAGANERWRNWVGER